MRRLCAGALALAVVLLPLLEPGAVHAAEYEMATVARYVVDPTAGSASVSVEVTFTNTTPNPPGQLSAFDHIDLAIHDGATQVAAADSKGSLSVSVGTGAGVQVASVKARARVRYNRSVTFTLSYLLTDGSTPQIHVRAQAVKFAVFGFGTSSSVSVELPATFEARADGDPMVIATADDVVRLTSGPIAEPASWLALVTASGPTTYDTRVSSVALASATADLQVRAWTDDPGWGERTLATLVAAMPILEEEIGLPYPRVGPLVVTEAVGGEESAAEAQAANPEIQASFDGSDFTLLHQAAHIWIDEHLAADRWIREGLASHYAERAAASLGVDLPYDPATRAGELSAEAQPLAEWRLGATGGPADAYAYAASWAFLDQIATAVGEEHLGEALQRVVAGVSAYDPAAPGPVIPGSAVYPAVDTRRLLDQLATTSGIDLADMFGAGIFGPDVAGELAERTTARVQYAELAAASGDWGTPQPIRNAMAAWRFAEARAAMAEASGWLAERDGLVAKILAAGLTTPTRLHDRFIAGGGNAAAQAELEAELAVVDLYLGLQPRAGADGLLERIGLFAADDPRGLLAAAAASFNAGDLQAAAARLDQAQVQINRGPTNGVVRIASAAVLVAVLVLLASHTIRRRAGSHYTAGP